jgi:predicted transposase YbfD/YdcC
MSIETLVQHFGTVEDPRCCGKIEHRLLDILVIAVCAVIACAESWCDIALYGRSKLAWLQTFLELPNGIPSHDTFRRVFMLIDPDTFETGFTAWVGSLTAGFERAVVAIDGKTIRRSFDHRRDQSPLHVVSAWACEQRLVLGQRCVDGKSNEITAVPELLDQLALKNSIVTLDAMGEAGQRFRQAQPDGMASGGCQTAIAEKILARGGDYLLTLKGNHALAHAAVVKHFDQHCFHVGAPSRADCDAFDDTHGRLVRRRVFASTEAATLGALSGWPGLRTVLAVESIRSVNSAPTKVESEIRYFLSSCPDSPAVLGQAIRSHWAVENALHWVLDVTFREDDSRVRDRTAARNLALLRKIALNIVGRDRTSKASVRARRKKAAWNNSYMLQLLVG